MAKFWRKKVLLADVESGYGVNPNPTGAANAILATDVSLSPMEGQDIDRDLDTPWLGASGTIPADLHQKLSFKIELAPAGTAGTAPAWGVLLRGCAVAETVTAGTSVEYNPVSEAHESLGITLNIDGSLYTLLGTRGSCKIEVAASGIPYLNFEFTSLWNEPVESAPDTPDLSAFQKPRVASKANTPVFTIGGDAYVLRSLALDFANAIAPQFLIGEEEVLINDKGEMLDATIRAVPLTTLNPYALAAAQTTVPVVLQHGTTAGSIATLSVPKAQMQRPAELANADGIVEWPLKFAALPDTGNDQWTLTLT